MADAYFSNVSLLLPLDGSAAATTFRDYSNNHHVVTTAGNVISKPVGKYNGSAAYFDGTGDYLTTPDSADWDFGTGDFTVEGWFNFSAHTTIAALASNYLNSSVGWTFQYDGTTSQLRLAYGGTALINASWTPTNGTWYYLALCRSGASLMLFVDGTQIGTTVANSTDISGSTSVLAVGALFAASWQQFFTGYMADLRITKGVARYTAAFTTPTAPIRHALDPNVVLRLTGEDLFDYSQTAAVLTASEGAAVSATQFKYGTKSLYFDGSGDYVTITSNAAFAFGTGDFTVEFWAYPTRDAGNETIIDMRASDTTIPLSIGKTGASVARCYDGTTVRTGGTFPINAWSHIAWVRSGTTNTIYIDGASAISFTNAFDKAAAAITLGSNVLTSAENYQGYIDDLTITRRAKYTATFARPAIQLPTETTDDEYFSSVVLQLQMDGANTSTTFTDSSNTPKTVTAVGNAQISTTQSRFGGSALALDGTSDYLSVPTSTDFSFGSGDFTVEFWIYFNSVAAGQRVIGVDINTNGMSWGMYTNASGTLNYFLSTTGASWNLASAVLMGSVATGSWYHVALCRSGGVFRPYINGVMGTTTASASALYASTYPLLIGAVASSYYVNGYIDDLRITKGVARYV